MSTPYTEPASTGPQPGAGSPIESIIAAAKAVITDPETFFAHMAKSGGYMEPVIFVVVMAAVTGLVGVLLAIVGLGAAPTVGTAIIMAVVFPVSATIGSFLGALLIFAIWKLMGSKEDFETAYRCGAYTMAISPVTMVLGILPFLGSLAAIGWALYLAVIASDKVHGLERSKAWVAFGLLFGLMALMSISGERAARQMEDRMQEITDQLEGVEDLDPEEAGRAVGDFLKGLQDSVEKKSDE